MATFVGVETWQDGTHAARFRDRTGHNFSLRLDELKTCISSRIERGQDTLEAEKALETLEGVMRSTTNEKL